MNKPGNLFVYSIKLVKVMRKYTLSCIHDISCRKIDPRGAQEGTQGKTLRRWKWLTYSMFTAIREEKATKVPQPHRLFPLTQFLREQVQSREKPRMQP